MLVVDEVKHATGADPSAFQRRNEQAI